MNQLTDRLLSASTQTSQAAAQQARKLGTATSNRQRVLEVLASAGVEGMTDEEIQRRLDLTSQSETPRRYELVQLGHVVDSGRRRPTASGSKATVWILTQTGYRSLGQTAPGHQPSLFTEIARAAQAPQAPRSTAKASTSPEALRPGPASHRGTGIAQPQRASKSAPSPQSSTVHPTAQAATPAWPGRVTDSDLSRGCFLEAVYQRGVQCGAIEAGDDGRIRIWAAAEASYASRTPATRFIQLVQSETHELSESDQQAARQRLATFLPRIG